jgi:hypothetical protein
MIINAVTVRALLGGGGLAATLPPSCFAARCALRLGGVVDWLDCPCTLYRIWKTVHKGTITHASCRHTCFGGRDERRSQESAGQRANCFTASYRQGACSTTRWPCTHPVAWVWLGAYSSCCCRERCCWGSGWSPFQSSRACHTRLTYSSLRSCGGRGERTVGARRALLRWPAGTYCVGPKHACALREGLALTLRPSQLVSRLPCASSLARAP